MRFQTLKTTVCLDTEVYERLKPIAAEYFSNTNAFMLEAIREGLRDYARYDPGDVPLLHKSRVYLEEHGGGLCAKDHANVSIKVPRGLCRRVWDLRTEPFACFVRVWISMFLEHDEGYWEGSE